MSKINKKDDSCPVVPDLLRYWMAFIILLLLIIICIQVYSLHANAFVV